MKLDLGLDLGKCNKSLRSEEVSSNNKVVAHSYGHNGTSFRL